MKKIKFDHDLALFCCFILFSLSCGNEQINSKLPESITITKAKLESLLVSADTTVLVFWTSWCPASKSMTDEVFKPAHDSIVHQHSNNKIVFILADDKFDPQVIKEEQAKGLHSFYLPSSGTHAFLNRRSIKKFLNECYPKNEIDWLGFGFGIPAAVLIAPNNKGVINVHESESGAAVEFLFRKFLK